MDFVPIYSGYACIRRYIWERNPNADRLDEKYPPLHMHRKVRTYIRREPACGACRRYYIFFQIHKKNHKFFYIFSNRVENLDQAGCTVTGEIRAKCRL
jgi:hypothetical protein